MKENERLIGPYFEANASLVSIEHSLEDCGKIKRFIIQNKINRKRKNLINSADDLKTKEGLLSTNTIREIANYFAPNLESEFVPDYIKNCVVGDFQSEISIVDKFDHFTFSSVIKIPNNSDKMEIDVRIKDIESDIIDMFSFYTSNFEEEIEESNKLASMTLSALLRNAMIMYIKGNLSRFIRENKNE